MVNLNVDNVSRETLAQLRDFENLVRKWTKKINLVSTRDADQIWDRHIVDSVQVYELAPKDGCWLDIGSGGGFPGIVVAILAKEKSPERRFTLVDSDQRKCAFLRTAARELKLNVTVVSDRVEKMDQMNAAVMSARALDDLDGLFAHMERHLIPGGTALFPKGVSWKSEHEAAQKNWSYEIEPIRSETNPDATILKIKELSRV